MLVSKEGLTALGSINVTFVLLSLVIQRAKKLGCIFAFYKYIHKYFTEALNGSLYG